MTAPKEPKKLTTRDVAEKIGTDPKRLRVFLRAESRGVGTGKRYSFTAKDVAPLKKRFAAWEKEQAAKKKAQQEKAAAEKKAQTKEKKKPTTNTPADGEG